jgi:hypothetical protein
VFISALVRDTARKEWRGSARPPDSGPYGPHSRLLLAGTHGGYDLLGGMPTLFGSENIPQKREPNSPG